MVRPEVRDEVAATKAAFKCLREAVMGSMPQLNTPGQAADIIRLAEQYAAHQALTLATVSTYAGNDGKLFRRMKLEGAGCTLKTAARLMVWFSDHWPSDLEWPRDIPRPPKSKEAA